MSLLKNAIESIQVGVEDFEEGSRERITSAVRNIHAGILLLYKEALRRLSSQNSNDVLIKNKIVPTLENEQLKFIGVGNKTVNVSQIKNRFKRLGIRTDWKKFEFISKIRNDIEHYYTEDDHKIIQQLIAKSFTIISTFIETELKENPFDLLGFRTWTTMLEVSEVYEKQRRKCLKKVDEINWVSTTLEDGVREITCVMCDSDLLMPTMVTSELQEVELECRTCGVKEKASGFIPRSVQTALGFESYKSYVDGLDYPYGTCPECGLESYVMEERRCAFCGEEANEFCNICGEKILPSEMMCSPLCGYCANKFA